jgi:hypothetical protein
MYAVLVQIPRKEADTMLTKEFFDKHFKMHNKIVLYTTDNICLTISKAYHFHLNGGHQDFDIHDSQDLAELCEYYKLSTERRNEE